MDGLQRLEDVLAEPYVNPILPWHGEIVYGPTIAVGRKSTREYVTTPGRFSGVPLSESAGPRAQRVWRPMGLTRGELAAWLEAK